MNGFAATTLVLAGLLLAAPATTLAAAEGSAAQPAAMTSADMAEGEIRKVDKAQGKLTIKHGPIKNLDMPSMTMVFRVNDKALLDKVKAGDKVKFKAMDDDGKLTVTEINAAK